MDDARLSRFSETTATPGIGVSFEFFPPKTAEMEQALWVAIRRLAPLRPNFVSVTYGAGGSTRERTHATVKRILAETTLTPAAHLTCVAATRAEVDAVVGAYARAGVRHIVALRGDPLGGVGERFSPHPDGYRNAADLVSGIKRMADIEVSVSAYPEKHPDSATVAADIDMLKAKVDAGASRAITQFFSRIASISVTSTACAQAVSTSRSYPASCRCRISSRPEISRRAPARRCPTGSPAASTVSTTIRQRASSSPPQSPPSRCSIWSTTASAIFIFTP